MSFKSDIARFNKNTEKKATLVFRGTALSLFSKVILGTPVGNKKYWKIPKAPPGYVGGILRGNWQIGINSAPDGELDVTDSQGSATVNQAFAGVVTAKLGDSIFLINNLPYAKAVEDGSSKQAPTGMVKTVVAEFKRVVKGNIKK